MPCRRSALHATMVLLLTALVLVSCAGTPPPSARTPPTTAVDADRQFAAAVNAYRARQGLPRIAVSASLMKVARTHLRDLELRHRPGGQCNMHSWSTQGDWSPCCYTPDHAAAACMWNKPREVSGGAYTSPGYEIVAHYTDPISPVRALEIWRESPPHHAMLLNTGQWHDNTWRALGAAIGRHYAVVWFGEAVDPVSE